MMETENNQTRSLSSCSASSEGDATLSSDSPYPVESIDDCSMMGQIRLLKRQIEWLASSHQNLKSEVCECLLNSEESIVDKIELRPGWYL